MTTSNTELPRNVAGVAKLARERLDDDAWSYLAGGSDDGHTLARNEEAWAEYQIRCRRLVDVSSIDTSFEVFGESYATPIGLAPVGFQAMFDKGAEASTARAAAAVGAPMLASTVSSLPVGAIAAERQGSLWFQLYPTTDRGVTRDLLAAAEGAGCTLVALTVDVPVFGNREEHVDLLAGKLTDGNQMGNLRDLPEGVEVNDPTVTWDTIGWLRENTSMRVALKGIVTAEDAKLAAEHGVDALVVSNHGGRQEESNRSTAESLPEVISAVRAAGSEMPVFVDGGVRRGTDVLKALALGASAVFVGRPYVYGLAAAGEAGVRHVLDVLNGELVHAMQLAGIPSLSAIDASYVE